MTLSVFDAAAEAPDRDAVVVGGRVLSWGELAERTRAAHDALVASGMRPGSDEPLAIDADLSLDALTRLYAALAAGVTVHPIHPSLTTAERAELSARVAPISPADLDPRALAAAGVAAPDSPDERALAVVYTSGTSGRPKGVVLSRRAFAASARASAANLGWRADDRWLLRIPLAHIGGLSTVTRCLIARRCIVLADRSLPLLRQLERDRVTLASLVPTLLARLLDEAGSTPPPASLRAVLLGGAAAPADLLARAADARWPVLTTYGLTEACSQVTTQPAGTVNRGELGSGRPLDGVDIRIVDGGIRLRGRTLFSGYFPPSENPAGDCPFTDDDYFVTGDRGRIDDAGFLHVLGRASDLIVSGGENVDPLEVEQALRDCDGVGDAAVFGVPDREWGERVAALIVLRKGAELDTDRLTRHLAQRLAAYKRPRALAFAERLPLGPSGKLDRRAARRLHEAELRPLDYRSS